MKECVIKLLKRLNVPQYNLLKKAMIALVSRLLAKRFMLDSLPEPTVLEEDKMLVEKIERWSKELIDKGRKEGIEEGFRKGAIDTLERILFIRFGQEAFSWKDHIENASMEEIKRYTERVLIANTIEDVFKD